ncbi:SDR family NAD(P)-dependent oxidoreductase [Pontibacterium granulatum]|uniref:SDR family NAD(P)-dependent oxidoreductase n=1 Tax=Pontibacterium granulatum TaxID=2036029 RepID=UPI00249AF154|nr:SDR family NAD(P)-dependent oxidoreductase [Pontibacterium granulatum]MDI3324122.1 SDR family NAD(P)-dependent oxidoreductase [Pontibacterium granulatum]
MYLKYIKEKHPMVNLDSFDRRMNVVVAGASGGIGHALVQQLVSHPSVAQVHALTRNPDQLLLEQKDKLCVHHVDILDEASLSEAAKHFRSITIDLFIVASGILHGAGLAPEKSLRALQSDSFIEVMQINALAPMLVAKHFLPRMTRDGKAVFSVISARVGSISDNRLGGWYTYRASKAALNMLLKTLSIESSRTMPNLIVAGLHPGTVDTGLSKPYQRNVKPEKLFTPDQSAAFLLNVVNGLSVEQSGKVLAWDGQQVDP